MKTESVTLLVGPCCTGKSTYLNKLSFDAVISSDNIVDDICAKKGISYSDFFELEYNHPTRRQQRKLFSDSVELSKNCRNIVWDLTNLTKKDRERAMLHYPGASCKAINFEFKGYEELVLSLNETRGKETGKLIPRSVLFSMFKRYQEISNNEDFESITNVDLLKNIALLSHAV